MKITISAIGKGQKPSPTFILFEEYRRRTPWKIELKEMEEKKNLNSFQLKESEAKMLLDNHISFLSGGALGHGKEGIERANSIISFGNMTWPHMLVRSMLSEQIYRAYTIIHKHPYHKD